MIAVGSADGKIILITKVAGLITEIGIELPDALVLLSLLATTLKALKTSTGQSLPEMALEDEGEEIEPSPKRGQRTLAEQEEALARIDEIRSRRSSQQQARSRGDE